MYDVRRRLLRSLALVPAAWLLPGSIAAEPLLQPVHSERILLEPLDTGVEHVSRVVNAPDLLMAITLHVESGSQRLIAFSPAGHFSAPIAVDRARVVGDSFRAGSIVMIPAVSNRNALDLLRVDLDRRSVDVVRFDRLTDREIQSALFTESGELAVLSLPVLAARRNDKNARVDFVRMDSDPNAPKESVPIDLQRVLVFSALNGLTHRDAVVFIGAGERHEVKGIWVAEVHESGEATFVFHPIGEEAALFGLVRGIDAFGVLIADGVWVKGELFRVERGSLVRIMESPFARILSQAESIASICSLIVGPDVRDLGTGSALDIAAFALDGKRRADATVRGDPAPAAYAKSFFVPSGRVLHVLAQATYLKADFRSIESGAEYRQLKILEPPACKQKR